MMYICHLPYDLMDNLKKKTSTLPGSTETPFLSMM